MMFRLIYVNVHVVKNDKHVEGALLRAVQIGHSDVVQALLKHARFERMPDDSMGRFIFEASVRGHDETVRVLLSEEQTWTWVHFRALCSATVKGNVGIVKMLLNHPDANRLDVKRAIEHVNLIRRRGNVDENDNAKCDQALAVLQTLHDSNNSIIYDYNLIRRARARARARARTFTHILKIREIENNVSLNIKTIKTIHKKIKLQKN